MNNKGFTLVELLIAMAIASVVGMAGLSLFSSTNWAYKVNEDLTEAQQNVRIATDRIAKDIRMAGFGLPEPPFQIGFDTNNDSVADLNITAPVTFANGGAGASDTITVLGGGYEAGALVGSALGFNGSGAAFLCYSATSQGDRFFGATNNNGEPYFNRRNISLNGTTQITLAANQAKNTCNSNDIRLGLGTPAQIDKDYPDGTPVFIIQAVQYSIGTTQSGCSASVPCLVSRDYTQIQGGSTPTTDLVVAEGIEDIQFAYGIDLNPRDGKIDYTGPYGADDFLNAPTDASSIIAVRANIVGKTRNPDPKGGSFTRPAIEDRTASSADAYRRRVLMKIIKLRNPRQGA